ncbi:MAG: ATP-binding protein [Myxococcota bacterium]
MDDLANELCRAVDGDFSFAVTSALPDETVEKLTMLVNFVLDAARRAMRQLADQNARLAELDRLKSEFLANVSHELRTPLTLIQGPLECLHTSPELPPALRESVQRMRRNTARLAVMVDDLLDFARLEADRMHPRWQAVDASSLVAGVVEDAQPSAAARGITLSFHGDESLGPVPADKRVLEKILLNLLGNALKFTPRGGRVAVSVQARNDKWELAVTDTGVGIAANKQAGLFVRFYQADTSASRNFEGTGIGLALVKELAERMGGSVDFLSTEGAGSRFWVTLPRSPDSVASLPRETEEGAVLPARTALRVEVSHEATPPQDGSKPRVMVVDDNVDMRGFIAELLAPEFAVVTAENGRQALQLAREHAPEVVLSDVMMPEMDGLELLARFRADPVLRRASFLVITARAGAEAAATGLDAGADDYLAKPFSPAELRARVRSAWRLRRQHAELEERTQQLTRANADLQEAQTRLVQAGKMAALGTLVAGLSHELNNPLGIILMAAQSARRHKGDEAALVTAMNRIEQAARRAGEMVRVLDLARCKPIKRERLEVGPFMERVVSFAEVQARRRRVRVELEPLAPGLPAVWASLQQMESALLNLVSNAVEACPPSGLVRLGASRRFRNGEAGLEMTVTDTGNGIPPDVINHIFEPFFTTKPVGQGTGLGLSIVQNIVQAHQGTITPESTPGRGTTMHLWLPAATSPQPGATAPL